MASITAAQVKTLNPDLLGLVSDEQLEAYIDIIKSIVDEETNNIFTTTTVTEGDLRNYQTLDYSGSSFISIDAWQDTGLTIKRIGQSDEYTASPSVSELTLGEDYSLYYAFNGRKTPGLDNRVVAIKLRNRLYKGELLRVYGTYGWFPTGGDTNYPADVRQVMASICSDLANFATQKGLNGSSVVARTKDLSSDIQFNPTLLKSLYEKSGSVYYSDELMGVINRYRLLTESSFDIL